MAAPDSGYETKRLENPRLIPIYSTKGERIASLETRQGVFDELAALAEHGGGNLRLRPSMAIKDGNTVKSLSMVMEFEPATPAAAPRRERADARELVVDLERCRLECATSIVKVCSGNEAVYKEAATYLANHFTNACFVSKPE